MKYIFYFLSIFLIGCSGRSGSTDDETSSDEESSSDAYSDGKHCAEVAYYNPTTGTRSTYTLNVEVENNELVTIYWGNGGWLDESHFSPTEIDEDGSCSFTSDKGNQYEVTITGEECSGTDNPVAEDEKKDYTMLLGQCASEIQMTETELAKYEKDFHVKRTDVITNKMCEAISDYMVNIRKLNSEWKDTETDKQIENGYIQGVYAMSLHDEITCQQIIVKRKGIFYRLEVQGGTKSTTGTMQFDPNNSDWQNVIVKESPKSTTLQVHNMRIIDQSRSLASLKEKLENYCSF